jgi:hypothetical protein
LLAKDTKTLYACGLSFEDIYSASENWVLQILYNFYRIQNGGTLFIDDFSSFIHTNVWMPLINIFNEFTSERSQLILTTNNSKMLDLDFFDAREICFIEKNKDKTTKTYSLADFG